MNPPTIICPLCSDKVDKLLYRYHLDSERIVIEKIRQQNPAWTRDDGACSRCVDYYHTEIVMQQRILPEIGPHFPIKSADDFIILPTALRLDADQRFTGKGITICFIDSGFYPHPDLINYRNRIKAIIDIANTNDSSKTYAIRVTDQGEAWERNSLEEVAASWHGTMTSVVCAGDGYLSKGLYKGIASDAELVLLKVQDKTGRVSTDNIVNALHWVLQHHKEYGIRIVNMSLGGDEAISYKQSEIDRLAEQLIREGVAVVAAAGNDENGLIKPPANSPNVITVGGADDDNDLRQPASRLYHSTYGTTTDEFSKPELVAHAIWIAAPILPGTREKTESEFLHQLLEFHPDEMQQALRENFKATGLDPAVLENNDPVLARNVIMRRIQTCKYISGHYMHVDGTSFAAPIVSAVIAQLLEINPQLTPVMIRQILFSTAKRIENLPAERQGFGVIHPRKSILAVLKRSADLISGESPRVNNRQNTIEFYVHHDCASQVALAGTFNHWAQDVLLLEPGRNGTWKIEIPMLPAGTYRYKFFIDDKIWMEDINNPYREPDGYNGFNSIFVINN